MQHSPSVRNPILVGDPFLFLTASAPSQPSHFPNDSFTTTLHPDLCNWGQLDEEDVTVDPAHITVDPAHSTVDPADITLPFRWPQQTYATNFTENAPWATNLTPQSETILPLDDHSNSSSSDSTAPLPKVRTKITLRLEPKPSADRDAPKPSTNAPTPSPEPEFPSLPRKRRYHCTVEGCNGHFSTSGHLGRHLRTHIDARPHKCAWDGPCDRWFSRLDNMKQHMRTHDPNRPPYKPRPPRIRTRRKTAPSPLEKN
ncbi:hypothetical protein HKX48_007877 [Thoreauomyces humboldtii]|nr:hypothetical protein HKX48_007877 [Thoreauomyces humboldtii]